MSEEIKDVLDNLQKGFADFKEAQNQKIEELEREIYNQTSCFI